jgi:hypothetical protein
MAKIDDPTWNNYGPDDTIGWQRIGFLNPFWNAQQERFNPAGANAVAVGDDIQTAANDIWRTAFGHTPSFAGGFPADGPGTKYDLYPRGSDGVGIHPPLGVGVNWVDPTWDESALIGANAAPTLLNNTTFFQQIGKADGYTRKVTREIQSADQTADRHGNAVADGQCARPFIYDPALFVPPHDIPCFSFMTRSLGQWIYTPTASPDVLSSYSAAPDNVPFNVTPIAPAAPYAGSILSPQDVIGTWIFAESRDGWNLLVKKALPGVVSANVIVQGVGFMEAFGSGGSWAAAQADAAANYASGAPVTPLDQSILASLVSAGFSFNFVTGCAGFLDSTSYYCYMRRVLTQFVFTNAPGIQSDVNWYLCVQAPAGGAVSAFDANGDGVAAGGWNLVGQSTTGISGDTFAGSGYTSPVFGAALAVQPNFCSARAASRKAVICSASQA